MNPLLVRRAEKMPEAPHVAVAIVGAGVDKQTITWGSIINSGRTEIDAAPYIVLIPSVIIFVTVMALNYLGDALQAKFSVRESAL